MFLYAIEIFVSHIGLGIAMCYFSLYFLKLCKSFQNTLTIIMIMPLEEKALHKILFLLCKIRAAVLDFILI